MTTSASGLFGAPGLSNYAAAKMGVVGLMHALAIEGKKHDIRVNCLGPFAETRMAQGQLAAELIDALSPDLVSPAVLALVAEDAPTRSILCAGAGGVEQAFVTLTRGIHLGDAADAAEQILARMCEIGDPTTMIVPQHAGAQVDVEFQKAGFTASTD
jgi:NAD(P)-dependent dehydrogenase (short-subunit alcohol dehydrogenase family)